MHTAAAAAMDTADACLTALPTATAAAVARALALATAADGDGRAFAGACVTVPLKESVVGLCCVADTAVTAVGASNTLVTLTVPTAAASLPMGLRTKLATVAAAAAAGTAAANATSNSNASSPVAAASVDVGCVPVMAAYNTDWIGIALPLVDALYNQALLLDAVATAAGVDSDAVSAPAVAVVVGAGGTARAAIYALLQIGFPQSRIAVVNRSAHRVHALQSAFPGLCAVTGADALGADGGAQVAVRLGAVRAATGLPTAQVAVVVSTLPGAASPALGQCLLEAADCESEKSDGQKCDMTGAVAPPVVFEAAYAPKNTLLMKQAVAAGCVTVRGIDMLIAQAKAQNRLWNGKVNAFSELECAAWQAYAVVPNE